MAKASATPVGALAKARAFALDKRKDEFENIRVKMSSDDMKESLPHVSSGSIVVDHLIGGIPNSFGVAPCPGFPRGRVSQIWGHEGAGKCLPADTLIHTPQGILTVGEIFSSQGLEPFCKSQTTEKTFPLFNRDGEVETTTHFTHNNRKTTYKIQTFSGSAVRSTANHPHLVMSPNGFWGWKHTSRIEPGDYLVTSRKFAKGEGSSTDLDTPYMLGLIVADGHLDPARVSVTNNDADIKHFIENRMPVLLGIPALAYPNERSPGSVSYNFNGKEFVQTFYSDLGWVPCNSPEKHLGRKIRCFDDRSMIAFLQGYFDCECSVDHSGIEVSSASRLLLDEVKMVLLGLGIISILREKKVAAYPDNDYWVLRVDGEEARKFIRKIGTRSKSRAGQHETFMCQPASGGGTNHDSIPNVGGLLQDLYRSLSSTTREDHHLMADYMGPNPRARLTYNRLDLILSALEGRGDRILLARLREIQHANYYYDRVESVTENDPEPTFDFAMSKSASFIANGFVTHNTSIALSAAAQVCREGGTVLYIDWENDIVPDYAMALGVPVTDETKFELLQPDNLEDGIKYALIYAAAGVDLIVFDSVGAAIPRRLTDRDLNDAAEQGKVGEVQAVWSQELPNLKRIIARSGTAVIGISQIRAEIGKMGHGPSTKPQGGNAWKFYASVRLELRRVQYENTKEMNNLTHKVEDKVSGSVVKVKAVKCKMSRSQGREEIFYLRGGQGVDNIRSILEIAISHGFIKKQGAGWFTWTKPDGSAIKLQGIEKMRQHMVDNAADFKLIDSIVRPVLGSGESAKQFVEDEDYEPVVGEDEPQGDLMGEVSGLLDE